MHVPGFRENHGAAAFGGLLYVMGGYDYSVGVTKAVHAYDPAVDTWKAKAALPDSPLLDGQGITNPSDAAVTVNGKIYLFGATGAFAYTPGDDLN